MKIGLIIPRNLKYERHKVKRYEVIRDGLNRKGYGVGEITSNDFLSLLGKFFRILEKLRPKLISSHLLNDVSFDLYASRKIKRYWDIILLEEAGFPRCVKRAKKLGIKLAVIARAGYLKPAPFLIDSVAYNRTILYKRWKMNNDALEMADMVLALSEQSKEQMVKNGLDKDKIKIIYNYADETKFKLKKLPEKFCVGFLGSLDYRKGILQVLESWELIEEHIQLLIAGTIRDEEIRDKISGAKKDERVKYLGWVSEPWKIIENISVLVLPTKYEGAARTNFEALAMGRPVITTKASGAPIKDGVEGFIIEADPEKIVDKVLFLYNNPEELTRMSMNAYETSKNFRAEKFSSRVVGCIEEMMIKTIYWAVCFRCWLR